MLSINLQEKLEKENLNFSDHSLSVYLNECSTKGFTPRQYEVYRNNFFYRTLQTVQSVAYVVIAAAKNLDLDTLRTAGQNLYEETGIGERGMIHLELLEKSHNIHAKKIFNLPPLHLKFIKKSKYITNETKNFVKEVNKLYQNKIYNVVLGARLAQESAAVFMLQGFYEYLFLPYKEYYSEAEFKKVSQYFLIHIEGTEQMHAENALKAAQRNYNTSQALHEISYGFSKFLEIQNKMWNSIYIEMKEAERIEKKIPILS